jgi:hypothetical protein
LVVIPSVWLFWQNLGVGINQQDCLDKGFCHVAVINVFKKEDWLSVVIAKLFDGYGLAEPRRGIWHL